MAKRKKGADRQEDRVVTRKEARIRARDRERNRKFVIGTGVAIGLALLVVIAGIILELAVKPNSTLATVGNDKIVTRDFWARAKLEKSNLEAQLRQLQQLEQQFGGQSSLFGGQISQIQATLSSPFSLGVQVLDQMIQEKVIAQKAAERGIAVGDAEVEEALREEVAAIQGAVTAPQATATGEVALVATAAAALFTPTPTPTVDAGGVVTATTTPFSTPEPLPTRPVLTEPVYQEGLARLETSLKDVAGMTVADYRQIVRVRLLNDKLRDQIGAERVSTSEEQAHVRHILILVKEPPPTPEASPTPLPEGEPTPTPAPTPEMRDEAAALALIQELRRRILDGEDFATLAQEYSDDPGSADEGGDLGWAPRGRYVPEFDEAAFSLPVGEIGEPVKTQYGFHLLQVLERDENRPKDEAQIRQEQVQAYQGWLQEQIVATDIQRPADLSSKLPSGL